MLFRSNKANLLPDEVATKLWLHGNAQVKDALSRIMLPRIIATAPTGSNVTCTKGTTTLTAAESSGTWTFDVPDYGTWTLTATKSGQTATKSVVVDQVKQYAASLFYLSNTFSANTWEAIIGACQSGSVPAAWVVGNQKAMTINSVDRKSVV